LPGGTGESREMGVEAFKGLRKKEFRRNPYLLNS